MKITYQSRMSEKILERRRKRRIERAWAAAVLLSAVGTFAIVGEIHIQQKKITAPSWADFVPMASSDTRYEYNRGINSIGVPTEITVNGERWSLVLVNHFSSVDMAKSAVTDRRMAETDCEHRTISYIETEDAERLKINLMHEVFHAGACLHGGAGWWNSPDNGRIVHPGIYHLGEFMATFAHDNPKFMEWEEK